MANNTEGRKSNRGFAAMDQNQQREIASKGGRAAHQQGTAHEFSSDEAREAGRKGGMAVSRNRQHMSEIGRKGGEARGRKRASSSSNSAGSSGMHGHSDTAVRTDVVENADRGVAPGAPHRERASEERRRDSASR